MAYVSVTNQFADSTSLDATELNQNWGDIINGVTDGSKSLNVADITIGNDLNLSSTLAIGGATTIDGSLSVAGATTISDDITIDTGIFKILSLTSEDQTIAAGAMTPTKCCVVVNGEGDLADNLDTITATNFSDGSLLLLKRNATSGDITIRNNVGNIICGANRTLSTNSQMLLLWDAIASKWNQVFYAAN